MSCTLIATGRIGQIDVRQVGDHQVTTFSIASSTRRKDKAGNYLTEWTRCDAWNKTGEYVAKYLKKGDVVEVHAEKFTTEKDGKYYTNYTVNNVERLAKGKASLEDQPAETETTTPPTTNTASAIAEEDIPF